MENQQPTIEGLKQTWKTLSAEVRKNRKLKFDIFSEAFSQTYAMLSQFAGEERLDKCYIEMIAEAFAFASIRDNRLDSTCLAALVLTERMITHCAFRRSADLSAATVYIAEKRREILLNFSNVNESVSALVEVFDALYWEKAR